MDEKERQELDLEDIIKEFGGTPRREEPKEELAEPVVEEIEPVAEPEVSVIPEEPEETEELEDLEDLPWPAPKWEQPEDLQATRRMEPVQPQQMEAEITGDTIRLDVLGDDLMERAQKMRAEDTDEEKIWEPGDTIHAGIFPEQWEKGDTIHREPFSENWEPEYEQPIGEYVPPQPIQFPRSRLRELKSKLVAGPEKRYYELAERGVGKLQAVIFLSLLVALIAAASTVMYAFGAVQEDRMRLMVFGQFLSLLIAALLGSFQLIEGIADLGKKKFSLNTMLVFTFLVCCIDGIVCLKQIRVPCCAAFSLQVTMSLWSTYQRRNRELSQLDTMRKATRLDAMAAYPDYLDGKTGLLRKEGQVEDFMDHYRSSCMPEKTLHTYSFVATCIALAVGVAAGVMRGFSAGTQVAAVSLLVAMPATAFVCHSRPAWLLERRLHRLGTVLCGWQGIEGLCGKTVFPLTFADMYPAEAVRLNGVKYFGSREPEQVVAYAAAVIEAEGSGLTGLFAQILDAHNGRHFDAYALEHYENGGVSGVVEEETVLLGSASFMKDMEVEVPESAKMGYAIYVAIGGELCGLFAVNYEKNQAVTAGLTTLSNYKNLECALISDDFMLTHGFLRNRFGIKPKRFLLPDYAVREQLRQKELGGDAQTLLMTTALGLAPMAFGVTGARALRNASRMGTVLHIVGGAIGLAIMVLLVVLGALQLITPANMFLYQLVWMIPALLITEWTRSV